MLRLATHSMEAGKTFCMNLSAAFLCSAFKEPMVELLPFVDILFGNETVSQCFFFINFLHVSLVFYW